MTRSKISSVASVYSSAVRLYFDYGYLKQPLLVAKLKTRFEIVTLIVKPGSSWVLWTLINSLTVGERTSGLIVIQD